MNSQPQQLTEQIQNDIGNYGLEATLQLLELVPLGRMISDLQVSDNDVVWLTIAIHCLNAYVSRDPISLHFIHARDCLKGEGIENDTATDFLARELVTQCRNLMNFIYEGLKNENTVQIAVPLIDGDGLLTPSGNELPEFTCDRDGWNILDQLFAKFLHSIGEKGKKAAGLIEREGRKKFQPYQSSGYDSDHRTAAWILWITKDPRPSLFTSVIKILTQVAWHDICSSCWERQTKQVPAIAYAVFETTIKPPFSKTAEIDHVDKSIKLSSSDGRVVADIPCVDPALFPIIRKGMQRLPSLTGHKLLRWEIRTGFNQWVKGEKDARLITCTGGYEGIAHQIGCGKSKQYPTDVKSILYAQAYGRFADVQGSFANMITLQEMDHLRNGEPSRINIVLGSMLLPGFTFYLPEGRKRRLIPITALPPLIGSKNTHAAQAMLQLLLLQEFANQSDILVEKSSIYLPSSKLEELAEQAHLPKSSLNRVISGWTEDDLSSKAFLDKQGDQYTLGPSYTDVLDFLKYQGQARIAGSRRGKKRSQHRKSHSRKDYRWPKKKKLNPP